MPTNRDRVLAYLSGQPDGQDDGQIAAALGINRVQINAICHHLASVGKIRRGTPVSGGKIHNWLITEPDDVPPIEPIVWLSDSYAAQQFAYAGDTHLTEDQVKAAVKQALEAQGWHAEVRWGHAHGIDIEAIRRTKRFVLEAKGEGSNSVARSVNFDGSLGELLRRMNSSGVRYGLALPAHRQFASLVANLPLWIRQRLDLWFFFVRPAPSGLEVGVFPPDGNHTTL